MPRSSLPYSFFRVLFWRLSLCCLLLTAVWAAQAQTSSTPQLKGTPHEEVQKAMGQRKWPQALEQVDAYLKERPRDPQMRFWRARLLEELGQSEDAFEVYESLAQDYPELPEVQNNLGVMYAAKGKLDMAKYALEQALRNNPSYATAHENMGNILLHLAKQSFAKAAQLDPSLAKSVEQKILALDPVLQLTLSTPK